MCSCIIEFIYELRKRDKMRGLQSILSFFCNKFNTVKPVLSGHSKINKRKVLKTNGSLMKVKSIAEYSLGAFCNTSDLH